MNNALKVNFNWLTKLGIILVIISSLFLFTNLTTEFYDTSKFLVLLVITCILLLLLAAKFTLINKVVFIRTPLDVPLLLLLIVGVVSTLLSPSPYLSAVGNQLKIHGSLVSWAIYIIFYFVLVNSLRSAKEISKIFFAVAVVGAVLSVISLLAYTGITLLPPPWIHGIDFTPTGSTFSTTAVLALLIPLVVTQILTGKNLSIKILSSVLLTLFGITIALTGVWATWIAAAVGLGLTIAVSPLKHIRRLNQVIPIDIAALIAPLVIIALVTILSLIPPIGTAKNPIYTQAQKLPKEVQLGLIPSWKISVSTFRDNPFWGSGPSTYLFNFTNYKPIEFNSSKVWNVKFDNAFNEYLGVLATLGGIGIIVLLSLTVLFISSAYPSIIKPDQETNSNLKQALAISGILFFIILALHASTLVLWVFGLLIIAAFFVINIPDANPTKSWSIGDNIQHSFLKIAGNITSTHSSEETITIAALPSILLTICVGVVLFALFFAGKFTLADYHHRIALNAISANQGLLAYNQLVAAEKLNPYNDLYRIDLAQTNFALASAIATAKAPTEASPAGSLTDEDKQNIQVLLQQAINEGKNAVALSPRSAQNWEILGLLYRQIAGVAQNALIFSLDSYGKAIFQDPLNPNLRLSVGGVYYATQNYDLAIRFFTDALNLKPDFVNGYYNLSVALKDKGDLANAQSVAEKLLTLIETSSPDYKIASEYLSDLKNRIATGSADESGIIPPAAEASGALQQEELPKVVNVGTPPEKIATPPAVRRPNSTPEPTSAP